MYNKFIYILKCTKDARNDDENVSLLPIYKNT